MALINSRYAEIWNFNSAMMPINRTTNSAHSIPNFASLNLITPSRHYVCVWIHAKFWSAGYCTLPNTDKYARTVAVRVTIMTSLLTTRVTRTTDWVWTCPASCRNGAKRAATSPSNSATRGFRRASANRRSAASLLLSDVVVVAELAVSANLRLHRRDVGERLRARMH